MFIEPTVVGDIVYVGSCAGRFYAFDTKTGDVRWSYDVTEDGSNQFHGNPLVVDSIIIVGTDEGTVRPRAVYALDHRSGALIWKSPLSPGVASDIVVADDSLIFMITLNDSLIAMAIKDGSVQWSIHTGWQDPDRRKYNPSIERPRLVSSALVYYDLVLFAGRDSTLYCLKAQTGESVWSKPFEAIITSRPVLYKDRIVFGLDDSTLVSLDITTGKQLRRDTLDLLAFSGMKIVGDRLLFLAGGEDGESRDLFALSFETGLVDWTASVSKDDPNGHWGSPRVHVWDDEVVVGTANGRVISFKVETGEKVLDYKLGGAIRGIGHSDSLLFVGAFSGLLSALRVGR